MVSGTMVTVSVWGSLQESMFNTRRNGNALVRMLFFDCPLNEK